MIGGMPLEIFSDRSNTRFGPGGYAGTPCCYLMTRFYALNERREVLIHSIPSSQVFPVVDPRRL